MNKIGKRKNETLVNGLQFHLKRALTVGPLTMLHKYPKDLVEKLIQLWNTPAVDLSGRTVKADDLPAAGLLEDLVSTCYQVSQMKEESRDLRFRIMLCEPEAFNLPPVGPHRDLFTLSFTEARPYNQYEIMKLGPAIDFNNSIIGIRCSKDEGLQIWGFIHSGSRWTHAIHGGSKQPTMLPPSLGLNITGPGRITVCRGLDILAQLTGGNIISPSVNVFKSHWMSRRFAKVQMQLTSLHVGNPLYARHEWAQIDPTFVGTLYLEFFKHVISTVRRSGHGGTIISLPVGMEEMIAHDNSYISLKYRFAEEGARSQFRTLVLEIMQKLAINCGQLHGPDYVAGWKDYVALQREGFSQLDEQIFKFARFVARLTGVDGAVVTTEGPEIIGFGGIIQGLFEMGGEVARALDPEGKRRQIEKVEGVGTRHRSLYALCNKLHNVLGIVVSQDAEVRAVTWNGNMVTCWDVIPIDFS